MKKQKNYLIERAKTYIGLRSIVPFILTIGVIFAFLFYIYLNVNKFLELVNISIGSIISLLVFSLVIMFINGSINTLLFRGLGTLIPYKDGFFLATASTLANQLPVSGGMLTRGFYLKRKYNLSYSKFFSVSLALFVCYIAVNGLIGFTILIYWKFGKHLQISPLLSAGYALMATCILLFLLPLDRVKIPPGLHKWTSQAVEGWMFLRKNPILGLKLIGLQTILMLTLACRYWIAFHMLSQNVKLGDVLLFSSASVLTLLISIAPGGLGVTESIVGAVATALGFDLGVSVVAVGLDRLISTPVVILVGGISVIYLGRQISNLASPEDNQPDRNA